MKIDYKKIYTEFIKAKLKNESIVSLSERLKVSRQMIYYVVDKVEAGESKTVRNCIKNSVLECVWKSKYKAKYNMLPKPKTPEYQLKVKILANEMANDVFNVSDIAKYLKIERTTLIYYLNK